MSCPSRSTDPPEESSSPVTMPTVVDLRGPVEAPEARRVPGPDGNLTSRTPVMAESCAPSARGLRAWVWDTGSLRKFRARFGAGLGFGPTVFVGIIAHVPLCTGAALSSSLGRPSCCGDGRGPRVPLDVGGMDPADDRAISVVLHRLRSAGSRRPRALSLAEPDSAWRPPRPVGGDARAQLRFWIVEHPLGMVVAIALTHIGRARIQRTPDRARKRRLLRSFFGLAIVLILASIPWPGLPYGRPWGRMA